MALHVIFSFVFCYLFFITYFLLLCKLRQRVQNHGKISAQDTCTFTAQRVVSQESAGHTWKCLAHSCHGVDNTGLRDLNFVGTFFKHFFVDFFFLFVRANILQRMTFIPLEYQSCSIKKDQYSLPYAESGSQKAQGRYWVPKKSQNAISC